MPQLKKTRTLFVWILFNMAVLLALEGFFSVTEAWRTAAADKNVRLPASFKERTYCRYDSQLGWVPRAHVRLDNLYGPGKDLVTNSRGFRNREEFAPQVPEGKIRIVCSGDSFTLGDGVANDKAWCNSLPQLSPKLEAVNLGVGGYGLDQAYLRYRETAPALDHQIHLFAFIMEDVLRTAQDRFWGYGKPFFEVAGGELKLRNVPVPQKNYRWPEMERRAALFLEGLQVTRRVRRWFKSGARDGQRYLSEKEIMEVLPKIFEALGRSAAERHVKLAVVLLPTAADYDSPLTESFRKTLRELFAAQNITCLDLIGLLKEHLSRSEWDAVLNGPTGHYTERGNEIVARLVYSALIELGWI